jgi:hypothetical protein
VLRSKIKAVAGCQGLGARGEGFGMALTRIIPPKGRREYPISNKEYRMMK